MAIYLINMSKGKDIRIDDEDLVKIEGNLSASLIRIKQGIINPSFMISITPTEEEEFRIKPKIELVDGVARVVGTERVRILADKMNITKKLN
jgi:hypothetical protein